MKVEVLSESIWINLKLFKYLLELEFLVLRIVRFFYQYYVMIFINYLYYKIENIGRWKEFINFSGFCEVDLG